MSDATVHDRTTCRCWVCVDNRRSLGMATLEEADVELLSRLMSEGNFYEIDRDDDLWCIEITIGHEDVERMRSLIARITKQVALTKRQERDFEQHNGHLP